jgi:SMODS-associated NUDIX domain
MRKLVFDIFALIATSIWIQFCDVSLKANLVTALFAISVSLLSAALIWLYENRKDLKLWYQSLSPFYSKPELRLSIAYLFQIEHHGKYLLVRNARDQNHAFQPVGGVYKYYPGIAGNDFLCIGVLPDDNMPIDNGNNADLRVLLKHRRKLPFFLEWFSKEKDREVDPWREFYEELVSSGILPVEFFPHIQYKKIGTHRTGIQYAQKFKMDEFLLAEIFELLPTVPQQEKLKELQTGNHNDIIWATRDEILCGRQGTNIILPHSKKLFEYQIFNHNS